jgi:hypothetical protein
VRPSATAFANYCFSRTIEPVVIVAVLGGVMVIVLPLTQYEYGVSCRPSEIEMALSAVVYMPLVEAVVDVTPIPPSC